MEHLIYNLFKSFNMVSEPTNLSTGTLVKGSFNVDLTRKIDGLGKRLGIEAQITSLGDGGTKGMHNYRRSSGDRLLVGHGTDLNKLSGASLTLTKTITADFDAGTKDATITTAGNEMKLIKSSTESLKINQPTGGYTATVTASTRPGQMFASPSNGISAIGLKFPSNSFETTEQATLTLYDSPSKFVNLGSAVKNGLSSGSDLWFDFLFNNPIPTVKGQNYFAEVALASGTAAILYDIANRYSDGNMYNTGSPDVSADLVFRVYGADNFYTSGKWISPVYDFGTTPASASIAWNATEPTGTDVVVKARGSEDNQIWGDWQTVSVNGGGIPLARYGQVMVELNTNGGGTPSLQDFTITTESAFTQATSIKSGLSGNKIRFVDYRDRCYFTAGGRPQVYDGTNVRNVGVDPPATSSTLAASGTGLTGTYKVGWTYVNEYGEESNLGVTSTITLSNQGINHSAIPAGPAGTASRKLYRTKAGGTAFYYVTTIEDNTTTVLNGDNTADANLLTPLETDNDIPPSASIILEHKNYMLYVSADHPERLYSSKPGLPGSVPAFAYKSFPGAILGIATYQDAVIVSGEQFTKAVIGDIWDKDPTIDNTSTRNISNEQGTLSQEAMVECFSPEGDVLVFPTKLGLNYLTPGLQENSIRSIPLSKDVQQIFDQAVNKSNMAAIFDKGRLLLALNWYGLDTPVNTNDVILVYDFRTGCWSPPWYLSANGFCSSNGKLYFGSSEIGQVYEMDKGTSDDGQPIHMVANLSPTLSVPTVRLKKVRAAVADGSQTATLQITPSMDGVGSDPIIPGVFTKVSEKHRIDLPKGNEIGLKIEDNSTNNFIITQVDVEYLIRGKG